MFAEDRFQSGMIPVANILAPVFIVEFEHRVAENDGAGTVFRRPLQAIGQEPELKALGPRFKPRAGEVERAFKDAFEASSRNDAPAP